MHAGQGHTDGAVSYIIWGVAGTSGFLGENDRTYFPLIISITLEQSILKKKKRIWTWSPDSVPKLAGSTFPKWVKRLCFELSWSSGHVTLSSRDERRRRTS